MVEYPECEKLKALESEHGFLVKLSELFDKKELLIAKYSGNDDYPHPTNDSFSKLFYECYDIDPIKLEAERSSILESIRGNNV